MFFDSFHCYSLTQQRLHAKISLFDNYLVSPFHNYQIYFSIKTNTDTQNHQKQDYCYLGIASKRAIYLRDDRNRLSHKA